MFSECPSNCKICASGSNIESFVCSECFEGYFLLSNGTCGGKVCNVCVCDMHNHYINIQWPILIMCALDMHLIIKCISNAHIINIDHIDVSSPRNKMPWNLMQITNISFKKMHLIMPSSSSHHDCYVNPLRLEQNGQHLADDIFKCNFTNETCIIFQIVLV